MTSPWSSSASPSGISPEVHAPSLPLSFDWEDWWQLCLPGFSEASRFEDRLARATDLALALCEDLQAKGTWFCLVDQAQRHPELLRRIQAQGHAIALHGLDHTRACDQERPAFLRWLEEGKARLEDLCGAPVLGFRAPEWSLRGSADGFLEDVRASGFRYDSSRAPLAVLGDPGWPRQRHRRPDGLEVFPPPVVGKGAWSVPLWGWGMRTLPEAWLRRQLRLKAQAAAGTPLVIHPWELDEDQPDLPADVSFGHRWSHRAGLRGYGPRLRRMLTNFDLRPLEGFLDLGTLVP